MEYTLKVELTGPAEGMCVRKKYKSVADRVFKAARMRTASWSSCPCISPSLSVWVGPGTDF